MEPGNNIGNPFIPARSHSFDDPQRLGQIRNRTGLHLEPPNAIQPHDAPQPLQPPHNAPVSYLRHCDNGLLALCEKYHLRANAGNHLLPTDAESAQNLTNACAKLNLPLAELQNLPGQLQSLDNLPNGPLKYILQTLQNKCQELAQERHVPDVTFTQLVQGLKLMLQSNQFKRAISLEQYLQDAPANPLNGQAFPPAIVERLRTQLVNHIAGVLLAPNGNALSDVELQISMEQRDYDVKDPRDMLQLVRQTAASLHRKIIGNQPNPLRTALDNILAHSLPPDGEATHDQLIEQLAYCKKQFKEVREILTEMSRPGRPEQTRRQAAQYQETFELLQAQMEATARFSLTEKIRAAQEKAVQTVYEEGKSQSFSISIEAGPEFSLLNDRLKVGVKFGFTYTYDLEVTQQYGCITVTHTREPFFTIEGDIGKKKDPMTGSVTFGGSHVNQTQYVYNNPRDLLDDEAGSLCKKLLHYACPPEIPKTSKGGFFSGIANLGRRFVNGVKKVARGIQGLFSLSATTTALLQNTRFNESLRTNHVLSRFDRLKHASVNRKFHDEVHNSSWGGKISGQLNADLGPFDSAGFTGAYRRVKTTKKFFTGLLTKLGSSKAILQNFVSQEYQRWAGRLEQCPQPLRQEIWDFQNAQENPLTISPQDLLRKIAELQGEYNHFCREIQNDDIRKSFFFSHPRSPERQRLMDSRDAATDRGAYLRALMTRCASLKYQLQISPEAPPNSELARLKAACSHSLDALSDSLENPPVVLSRNHQLKLTHIEQGTGKSSSWSLSFQAQLPNLPNPLLKADYYLLQLAGKKGENVSPQIEANVNFTVPHGTTGYYKNHKRARLSFSVTGDMLLQYGPQLVSNVLKSFQQRMADQAAENPGQNPQQDDKVSFGSAVGQTAADFSTNMLTDGISTQIQQMVRDTFARQMITDAKNEELGVDKILAFAIKNKNVFTFSFDFLGTANGVRYGGMSMTNTRSQSTELKVSAPIPIGINVGGKVAVSSSSTEQVINTIGANCFSPLCDAMYDIMDSPIGCRIYAQKHAKALSTMANQALRDHSDLNTELKQFLNLTAQECQNLILACDAPQPPANQTIFKARQLCDNAFTLLKRLQKLPHADENPPTDWQEFAECQALLLSLQTRLNRLGNPRITEDQLHQAAQQSLAVPEGAVPPAQAVMDVASSMKLLELLF